MLIFRQRLACSVSVVSWQFPLWWWALSGGTVSRWPVVLYFHPNHILRNRHEVGLLEVNWEVWLPTYRETALCSHTGKTWAMPPLQTVIPKSSTARSLFCGAAQRREKQTILTQSWAQVCSSFRLSHDQLELIALPSAIIILMLITEVGKRLKALEKMHLCLLRLMCFDFRLTAAKWIGSFWDWDPSLHISSFPERNHNDDVMSLLRIWGKWLSAGEPGLLK